MTLDLQSPRFDAIASAWLAHIDARVQDEELSRHTGVAYRQVTRYLRKHLGALELAGVGRRQIQETIDEIRRDHGRSSARNALARLKSLWQWAVDEELTDIPCPAVRIRQPKQKSVRKPVAGAGAQRMSKICWDALLSPSSRHPISEIHAGFFLLVCGAGLRSSEGTHARWEEWDAANRILTITRHKASESQGPKHLHLGEGPAFVLDHIIEQDWCASLPQKCQGLFFPSVRSRRGHIEDPWRPWQRLVKAAKLPEGTRIHDLRHGFADAVYAEARDLWAVKSALGHSSIATTERYVSRTPRQLLVPVVNEASKSLIGAPRSAGQKSEGSDA